ncbi:hypothetical protein [Nocardia sp. 852002-20019_SCH5090214]|uniref:hypothetical protein n=1 Tax=Nocardia sp. 852002-20019_SCH5090214 TaxID=1834087 RepID=UPI000ABAD20A|nr:hypothetical protein [Nocardia sp. 852002-20019_SCH5090214]
MTRAAEDPFRAWAKAVLLRVTKDGDQSTWWHNGVPHREVAHTRTEDNGIIRERITVERIDADEESQ